MIHETIVCRKRFIWLALACCSLMFSGLWSAAPAAVIQGTITDTLTKAPVESVLVTIKGTSTTTYTNSSGTFSLNTTTDIRRPDVHDALSARPGTMATVYGPAGAALAAGSAVDLSLLLSPLSDGIYFIAFDNGGLARVVKLAGVCRMGERLDLSAKASAAVTLVYAHKYYNTKEAVANEGDTSVVAKLAMWWPDSTNTGVPAGTVLTAYSGGTVANGAIIQNKDITGNLDFSASNVTIRNCKIHSPGDYWAIYLRSGTNLLVENCEIYSTHSQGEYTGIIGGNMTVRRCNIYNWENGMSVGSNSLVEDCYIHRPSTRPDAHNDGIEWGGGSNVVIRHNRITIRDETGCVNIGGSSGQNLTNNRVLYNLFSGGTFSLYIDGRGLTITSQQVIGNVWVKGSYTYGTHFVSATGTVWQYNCLNDGTVVGL